MREKNRKIDKTELVFLNDKQNWWIFCLINQEKKDWNSEMKEDTLQLILQK
jgi:hypothetical protein